MVLIVYYINNRSFVRNRLMLFVTVPDMVEWVRCGTQWDMYRNM